MLTELFTTTQQSLIYHDADAYRYLSEFFVTPPQQMAVFIDRNLTPAMYQPYLEQFPNAQYRLLDGGESHKTLQDYQVVVDQLLQWKIHRDGWVMVIGGGTLLDLVGFVCATYLRGIRYISVPTTTLSQIDAAVGGKVAINYQLKNALGAFHQPAVVLIDPIWLKTLPIRHYYNGLYEAVKVFLLDQPTQLSRFDDLTNQLDMIIAECITYKRDLVQQDEHDHGVRQLLNLGHTIGHALESQNDDQLLHGEAVMYGLMMMCDAPVLRRQLETLAHAWHLPPLPALDQPLLLQRLTMDKKITSHGINDYLITDTMTIHQRVFTTAEYLERLRRYE